MIPLAYNTIHLSTDLPLHPPNVIPPVHHPSIYKSISPYIQYLSPTTPSICLCILLSILHCHSPLISSIYTSTHCCSSTSPSIYLHIYHSVDLMSLAHNTIHLSTDLPLHPPNVIPPVHHPSIYKSISPYIQYLSPTTPSICLCILLSILHCHSPLISSIYTSTQCHPSTTPSYHPSFNNPQNVTYPHCLPTVLIVYPPKQVYYLSFICFSLCFSG